MKVRVFVYGTLREGEGNHRLLPSDKGTFKTVVLKGFRLYLEGLPYAIQGSEDDEMVAELWTFDLEPQEATALVERLDRLEGHPHFYIRTLLWVNSIKRNVWIYLLNKGYHSKLEGMKVIKDFKTGK